MEFLHLIQSVVNASSLLSIAAIFLVNNSKPWQLNVLIGGFVLIFLSSMQLESLINFESILPILEKIKKIDNVSALKAANYLHVWEVILPVTTLGIGINFISTWILSKNPNK